MLYNAGTQKICLKKIKLSSQCIFSSPNKLNRSISQNAAGTPQTPAGTPSTQNRVNGFLTPTNPVSHSTPGGSTRTPADKQATGGPPISGLYSTPKQRRALHSASLNYVTPTITPKTTMSSTPVAGSLNHSITTPHHLNSNASIDELVNRYVA